MIPPIQEQWQIVKPAVEGSRGLAASQNRLASEVGAEVLRKGGNAVDAAVAMGLAIGAAEPWMSGLGGGGYMLVHRAREKKTWCISFPMPSPRQLQVRDYPLTGRRAVDAFSWPEVLGDRNLKGANSIGVPGLVAGLSLALEEFGTRSWAEVIAPGVALAEAGLGIDWYATLRISVEARLLQEFPESKRVFLPGGLPPVSAWSGGAGPRLQLGHLADTYRRLAEKGPREFYEGEIARAIVADVAEAGGSLSLDDMTSYRASIAPALSAPYRGALVHAAPGLTAGPTLQDVLRRLAARWQPSAKPDALAYEAYAQSLFEAYEHRFASLGAGEVPSGSTTHITVADKEGNFVALTQTLLYLFGSGLMLPKTGLLMNNAIAWFDPEPGKPNSLGPGKTPLCNMCPTVVESDARVFALGASGGRRIFPAVFQLVSFMTDHGMSVNEAAHQPRLDVSGGEVVVIDLRLSEAAARIAKKHPVALSEAGVYPAPFACANLIARQRGDGKAAGAAFIASPWAAVVAA